MRVKGPSCPTWVPGTWHPSTLHDALSSPHLDIFSLEPLPVLHRGVGLAYQNV